MNIITAQYPLSQIINAIIVIILTTISIRIVSYILNHLKKYNKNITLLYALKDLINFLIYLMAIIILFSIFGIDLKGILISIGIVGIALSFAAKDFIADFMSGFFIIANKSLEIGDVMQINTLKGKVTKIGLRNVTLLTETKNTVIIPNSMLSTTTYTRFENQEFKKVTINVVLPSEIDMKEFSNKILKIINNYDEIMKKPAANVEALEYNEHGPVVKVEFSVKKFNKKEEYKFIITDQIRKIINKN